MTLSKEVLGVAYAGAVLAPGSLVTKALTEFLKTAVVNKNVRDEDIERLLSRPQLTQALAKFLDQLPRNLAQGVVYADPNKRLELKAVDRVNKAPWLYAHRPNSKDVAVMATMLKHNGKDCFLFLENDRPPLKAEYGDGTVIEFPAGLVGDENENETSTDAALRETLEETGYRADEITKLTNNVPSSPGCVSEKSSIFLVKLGEKIDGPKGDAGVYKNFHLVPVSETLSWLKEQQKAGKAVSAQTYAALALVL